MNPASLIPAPGLSLSDTLLAGQTFCWQSETASAWSGFLQDRPCRIAWQDGRLSVSGEGIDLEAIRNYFTLDWDYPALHREFPPDATLQQALHRFPGLRLVREPWWECLANFLCSSLKPIPQIRRLNRAIRQHIGGDPLAPYPGPDVVAQAGEAVLRRCGLGYRARHLWRTARQIAEGRWSWSDLQPLDTQAAGTHLQQLEGVGPKIADCVLLYAASRLDALPCDVWMTRLLHQVYFPGLAKPPPSGRLKAEALRRWGPRCGLAQLYVFHAARHPPSTGA